MGMGILSSLGRLSHFRDSCFRTCAARVTVLVCVCVRVSVCEQISPLEHLFVLKTLSPTQRVTKVKGFA